MEYPKRVRVVYADGAEEVGLAIDPAHVDVGPMGLQVKVRELVEIDGVRKLVASLEQKSARGDPAPPPGSEEGSVRLRLKDVPEWWTSQERKKR